MNTYTYVCMKVDICTVSVNSLLAQLLVLISCWGNYKAKTWHGNRSKLWILSAPIWWATTGYFYVVCIYGETLLCSNSLWCDISLKSCRHIALIRYKYISQTTEIYFYKCRNNASFRICLLYTSTIFIVVVDTVRFIMGDTFFNRINVSFSFWLLYGPTLCDWTIDNICQYLRYRSTVLYYSELQLDISPK